MTRHSWHTALSFLLPLLFACGPLTVAAYDVRDYEEDAGVSVALMRDTGGDVYGGGFESGVWLRGAPVFGEIFGHWLANRLQDGNYYSVGMTLRLMPRWDVAPFLGGGGSYNGRTSDRNRGTPGEPGFREADRSYWKGHAEGGARVWFGAKRLQFFEASYRHHWTETGTDFNYGWIAIEYGQLF